MPALPSPKKDMRAGNDETDRLHFILGDTVDIQPWNDQFLAFVCESMAPLSGGQPKTKFVRSRARLRGSVNCRPPEEGGCLGNA